MKTVPLINKSRGAKLHLKEVSIGPLLNNYCAFSDHHYLFGGMLKKTCNFLQLSIQHPQHLEQFVHHNTAHLARSSSCLLLTQTASAHLLAAVQPIISLPPFLCSSSSLGRAQGRRGKGREGRGRREGRRQRRDEEGEGLLSSDIVIKESPALGWSRPLSYSHPVWLPDSLWSTHTAVCTVEGETDPREGRRVGDTEMESWEDDNCEVQLRVWRWRAWGTGKLRQMKGVKTVVSGRCSIASASWLLTFYCFMTLWPGKFALFSFFFFFLNHWSPTERHFTLWLLQPVDQDKHSHGATVMSACC